MGSFVQASFRCLTPFTRRQIYSTHVRCAFHNCANSSSLARRTPRSPWTAPQNSKNESQFCQTHWNSARIPGKAQLLRMLTKLLFLFKNIALDHHLCRLTGRPDLKQNCRFLPKPQCQTPTRSNTSIPNKSNPLTILQPPTLSVHPQAGSGSARASRNMRSFRLNRDCCAVVTAVMFASHKIIIQQQQQQQQQQQRAASKDLTEHPPANQNIMYLLVCLQRVTLRKLKSAEMLDHIRVR